MTPPGPFCRRNDAKKLSKFQTNTVSRSWKRTRLPNLIYDGMKLPPIKAFDKAENVIYIYSFSLSFVPGLSLAFVVADRKLIESLSYLVSVRMMAVDWTAQKLLAKYLSDGSYYGILDAFRENYARKQEIVCRVLDEMRPLGISYHRPRAGCTFGALCGRESTARNFPMRHISAGWHCFRAMCFIRTKTADADIFASIIRLKRKNASKRVLKY